jgi:OmcA/MtrC family decaheme c-type cytochrome
MRSTSLVRKIGQRFALAAVFLLASQGANSQTPAPAWGFAQYFKYNIENIVVNATTPGTWNVKVVFSVTNPVTGEVWDIKNDQPYQAPGAGLTIDIGWDLSLDATNTGSVNAALAPVSTTGLGTAAAMPIQVRSLNNKATGAKRCSDFPGACTGLPDLSNRFFVEKLITPVKFMQTVTTGRIGMEGHPVCFGTGAMAGCPPGVTNVTTGATVYANIPVRSETADFTFVGSTTPTSAKIPDQRRQVVDFKTKCNTCHSGTRLNDGVPIPRLSLHGNNRNENLNLCVMCHNPNQTDVPYRVLTADARTSGPETSIDMKRMVHAIHAGGFRETPFVVVGFNTSVNDFSDVRFPAKLSNCLNCHTEANGKGTFELPLKSGMLGSTVNTGSVYALAAGATRTIDVNPFNDLKITPTAATCSACHDKAEVKSHMIRTGGASFATLQQNIGVTVKERCASCHGPGKEKDVRKAHEISGSGGTSHD